MWAVSDGVLLALVALVTTIATGVMGVLLLVVTRWMDRKDKALTAVLRARERHDDWARQDEVAAKLLTRQEQTARQSARVEAAVIESSSKTTDAIAAVQVTADKTHALVNSDMTHVLAANLRLLELSLEDKNALVAMNRENGVEPTTEVLEVIAGIEAEIAELQLTIAARAKGQGEADKVR